MSYNPHVSRDPITVRSGALATSFDAAPVSVRAQNWNQFVFYVDLTLGTASDARIQFDVCSPSGDGEPASGDWTSLMWQDGAATSIAGGVCTVSGYIYEIKIATTGKYAIPLPCNYKWVRVRAKATGGTATLGITLTTGMA